MQLGDLFCNHTLHFCGIYLLISFNIFLKGLNDTESITETKPIMHYLILITVF